MEGEGGKGGWVMNRVYFLPPLSLSLFHQPAYLLIYLCVCFPFVERRKDLFLSNKLFLDKYVDAEFISHIEGTISSHSMTDNSVGV